MQLTRKCLKNGFSVSEQENQSTLYFVWRCCIVCASDTMLDCLLFCHNQSNLYGKSSVQVNDMAALGRVNLIAGRSGVEKGLGIVGNSHRGASSWSLSDSSDFWSTCCGQQKDLKDVYKLFFSHSCADTSLNIPDGILQSSNV